MNTMLVDFYFILGRNSGYNIISIIQAFLEHLQFYRPCIISFLIDFETFSCSGVKWMAGWERVECWGYGG
jgi:hypothetical protein